MPSPRTQIEYAEQIARDWNTPEERSGFAGFATRFEVDADYLQAFEVKVVGASRHQELWVPAEQLPVFNEHLVALIQDAFWRTLSAGTPELSASRIEATLGALAEVWRASSRAGLRLPEPR